MSDNVNITPGSGIVVRADDVGGVMFQYIKLDVGGDGVSKPVIAGGTDGLPVDLLSSPATGIYVRPAAGQTFPVSLAATVNVAAPSPLSVAAVVAAPVFVRLSDGTNAIATLPISGTVTANQGTPAAVASGWPAKITDGTDTVGISSVSTARALKVDVIQTVTTATAQTDSASFVAATTKVVPIAGVYDDSVASPTAGQFGGVRITAFRGLHVNLRAAAGTEIGSAAAPLRIDPTGTTKQGIKLFDDSGNAFSDTNPLHSQPAHGGNTRISVSVSLSASQTAAAVWTPGAGKKFVILTAYLVVSVTGTLKLFDGTDTSANRMFDGTIPTGFFPLTFNGQPFKAALADNILKYTSGTGLTAVITLHGYEV
jgi:hypothetical protein